MDQWITVISFTYPHEAHLVKGVLENRGILVSLKDELTVQVNNFYANAIGGVKLQVREVDYEFAFRVLVEQGYVSEKSPGANKFWRWFDQWTSKLPWMGKLMIEVRLLILVAILLVLIVIPMMVLSGPTTEEILVHDEWCVEEINFLGESITPYTTGYRVSFFGDDCAEEMRFGKDGSVRFPGLNSCSHYACWTLRNDSLLISAIPVIEDDSPVASFEINKKEDTIPRSIYVRKYKLRMKSNTITLVSDSLVIRGKRDYFNELF